MKKVIKIVLLIIIVLSLYEIKTYAAINASSKTVNSGENVSISITSDVPVVSYKVTLNDAGGLTFKNSSGGTGAGTTTITDAKTTGMTNLATYTFSTPIVTNDTIYKVSFSASAMDDENDNAVPNSTATATITVKGNSTQADNSNSSNNSNQGTENSNSSENTQPTDIAKLSNIKVSPVDFSGFRRDNPGPYEVTVENDVKSVKVTTYSLNGSKGVVKGGNNLQEGRNKITVTAYYGDNKGMEYTIYVTRKTAEIEETIPNTVDTEEKNEEEKEENKVLRLNNLVLDDSLNVKLEPNFDPEVFEYIVTLGNDYLDLEKLLITAIANIEGATITIDGNEDLIDGDNIVTITVEAEGYDTVWYRIKVKKGPIEEIVLSDTNSEDLSKSEKEILRNKIIVSVLVLIIVFIGIIFIAKECYESTNKKGKREKNNSAWEDEPLIKEYSFKEDNEDTDEQMLEDVKNDESKDIVNENIEASNIDEIDETEEQDLEKIKDEFFNAKRIEFEENIEKSRIKKHRRGKGKHA